jgi:inhibitor of KinA
VYRIYSIGDAAITLDMGNQINEDLNRKVRAMREWLLSQGLEGLRDVIISYCAVSVLYDPFIIRSQHPHSSAFEFVKQKLEEAWRQSAVVEKENGKHVISIPVCYDEEFGYDLHHIAKEKKLQIDEIIQLHSSKMYYVYMIGFLPGFSYLAEVDEKLVIPRKPKPVPVAAGSVGIAGSQTGIYSLNCPGGWQIIGRTPLKLFDATASPPVMLQAGNKVQFHAISKKEFLSGNW